MNNKLSGALRVAHTKKTAGFLCRYDADSCKWVGVAWVHNAKKAEELAGLSDGRCANLAINMHRGQGSIGGFALIPKRTKTWLKKGGIIRVTFPNGTTALYSNAERLSASLGISIKTALRYVKDGAVRGFLFERIKSPEVCTKELRESWRPEGKQAPNNLPY